MVALEAVWETKPAPAGLTLVASINEAEQKNNWEVEIPWVMGLIDTRSISKEIPGIREIKVKNRERILQGIVAVNALDALRVTEMMRQRKKYLSATRLCWCDSTEIEEQLAVGRFDTR